MKIQFDIKIIVALLFFNPYNFYSQTSLNEKEYYKWFDSMVSDGNIALYNGINYKEKYRTLKGNHKYFISQEYQFGDLVYEGQPYYDVEMKYDLFNDQLIVRLPYKSGYNFIQLDKEKITEFSINNSHFYSKLLENEKSLSKDEPNYLEVLYKKNNFILYKKNIKSRKQYLDREFIYSVFTKKSKHFLYLNNELYEIESKGNLIKLLPKQKKYINQFYNSKRVLRKSNLDVFMIQLIEHLENLVTNNLKVN